MKLIALGDCQTGRKGEENLPDYFWADVVRTVLPYVTLVNFGSKETGWGTWWKEWENVLAERPDVIAVFGGIYHFSFDENPNPFLQDIIVKMVDSARERKILLLLCSMQPFCGASFWNEERQKFHDWFNEWLEGFCLREKVVFIDAFEVLAEPGNKWARIEYVDGGWKLNKLGHRVLGEAVTKQLLKYVFERKESGLAGNLFMECSA